MNDRKNCLPDFKNFTFFNDLFFLTISNPIDISLLHCLCCKEMSIQINSRGARDFNTER